MKRLSLMLGGLVLGLAMMTGCCHNHGYFHDPYYTCPEPCYHSYRTHYDGNHAPYCCYCGHYHYGDSCHH